MKRITSFIIEAFVFGSIATTAVELWSRNRGEVVTLTEYDFPTAPTVMFDQEITTGAMEHDAGMLWMKPLDWDVLAVLFLITFIGYLIVRQSMYRLISKRSNPH